MSEMSDVKEKIKELSKEEIEFTKHSETRIRQRNLSKDKIKDKLFELENLEKASKEENEKSGKKYKLKYYESNKYDIIIIIVVFIECCCKIVTVWKNLKGFNHELGF